jgi:predicted house-cleaning noncanonical NTP pyrophosphatase (MazG superfamily)
MERLIEMEDKLIEAAKHEICENLEHTNTCELGQVIDMIKDIEEAIYYCAKTKKIAHEIGNEWEIYEGHHMEQIHAQHTEMTKTTMSN